MKITYNLKDQDFSYEQNDLNEILKSNFLLTNSKGDFLNLGVKNNSSKFQGFNYCDQKSLEIFKIFDEINIENLEVEEVIYSGYKIERKYSSKFIKEDNKNLETKDSFYLGPTGGFIYEIENYEGDISIDLDSRLQFDFDKWGRDYKTYKENGLIITEYTKISKNIPEYKLYFIIKSQNFSYDLIENWIEKEYSYSKLRNTEYNLFIYRLLKMNISGSKKIFFGASTSKEDAINQISLLEKHGDELINFDNELFNELTKSKNFKKPISRDLDIAYKLSNNAIYNFFNKSLDKGNLKSGFFAGFPWFSKVWTRDELVGLRSFINNEEYYLVKQRIFYYIDSINEETGLIKRIDEKGSLESCDSVFWLAKRIGDLIFKLEKDNKFKEVLSFNEIRIIYDKLNFAFKKITQNYWDKKNELLSVKDGDSWMDTIPAQFPLDVQVQFLEFISILAQLASILNRYKDANYFLDFENGLREDIRDKYFRNNQLFNEAYSDDLRSNVFLCYYFYPQLFFKKDWENIFDNALKKLKTSWGGISSLSKDDKRFISNYSGEKNESYHNGDSWYWINNLTAIVLNDLNEKKYREEIRNILFSSTKDILKMGTIGYGSEISSSSSQKAEGCLAQLWSSTTYLEMIDNLFERE